MSDNKSTGEFNGLKATLESLTKEKNALISMNKGQEEELESYRELGTPEEIEEALNKAKEIVETLGDVKVSDVKSIKEELDTYKELGTPKEIEEAVDKATEIIEEYKQAGTPGEVKEALEKSFDLINAYKELGSPDEIDEALDKLQNKVVHENCNKLAVKYNAKTEIVESMFEKVGDFSVVESLLEDTYGKAESKETKNEDKKEKKAGKKMNESTTHESSLRRIVRSINAG